MGNETARSIMGWSFTFGAGLFTLQFQGLGEHPFSSHPQLLLLSQLSIIVAFYASSVLTMVNLSVPQETAAWFIVMTFTFLMRVTVSDAIKWATWVTPVLLVAWRMLARWLGAGLSESVQRMMEILKREWANLMASVSAPNGLAVSAPNGSAVVALVPQEAQLLITSGTVEHEVEMVHGEDENKGDSDLPLG